MWQGSYDFELTFSLVQGPGKISTIQIHVANDFPAPRLMEPKPPRQVLIHGVTHTDDTRSVSEMKSSMRRLQSARNISTFSGEAHEIYNPFSAKCDGP